MTGSGTYAAIPVVGNIATTNLNGNGSTWLAGNGTFANIAVPTVGNIATLNLDGNVSNLLTGSGTYAAIPTLGLPLANGTSNINIAAVNGNVTLTSNAAHTWTFDNTGNLSVPGNILVSGAASPAPYISGFSSVNVVDSANLGGVLFNTGFISRAGNITLGIIGNANSNVVIANTGFTVTGNISLGKLTTFSVTDYANLPGATTAGIRAFINASNLTASGNFGNVVGNGGGNTTPVYSDGTNWRIG